jgi:hypothetical protein
MILLLILIFSTFCLFFPKPVSAQTNSFVTIVNPVRISGYNADSSNSLNAEYKVVKDFGLPATWLLTYDALHDEKIINSINNFNNEQEIGLFLEVGQKLCTSANVKYDMSYSWHHSANIFLTGYSQEDRIKLIDTAFNQFKTQFGYYPTSIGAWWVDAFSLQYMRDKYNVTANLGLADQYSTDGYRVWGTYWSAPYYPSRLHAGIPGRYDNKIDIVTLEWAPRDPSRGYRDSYYSTQDYLQTKDNLTTSYFEKLVSLYSQESINQFGQTVVGLESDLNAPAYEGEYTNQLSVIKKLVNQNSVTALSMSDFAKWYKKKYPDGTPVHFNEAVDLLGGKVKTFWYDSSFYRIGISYDINNREIKIFDLRTYPQNFQEPYYFSLNKDINLKIDIPVVVDDQIMKNSWSFNLGKLTDEKYNSSLTLDFEKGSIILNEKNIVLPKSVTIPKKITDNLLINVTKIDQLIISPNDSYIIGKSGYTFRYLTPGVSNLLKTKRVILILFLIIALLLFVFVTISKSRLKIAYKYLLIIGLLILIGSLTAKWLRDNSLLYFASQSEIETLQQLKLLEPGNVLVYDHQCLGCEYNSEYKPAVFDNLRGYIKKFSGKNITYNKSVFEAKDQKTAKIEFDKTNTEYIYVVNYENYREKVPFSPGDLGVELLYDNANSQIWRKI